MDQNEAEKYIVEHAFKSVENLAVAVMVHNSWPVIQSTIAISFFGELHQALKNEKLDGWLLTNTMELNPFKQKSGLCLEKPEWNGLVKIFFGAENAGMKNILFSVYALNELSDEEWKPINEALNRDVNVGSGNKWWPWWYYLAGCHRRLDNVDAIVALSGLVPEQKKKLIEQYTAELVKIANVVGPVIDSLAIGKSVT